MRNLFGIRSVLFSVLLLAMSAASFGQFGVSIVIAPPAMPVYEQPICPADGYLWTPGYWAYGDDGYYWVGGDWIQPPQVGFLWTPGYWGWGGNAYAFHEGYWGQNVGFYGGINYGYGYGGRGYEGGRWDNGRFAYNTSVNRVNTTMIHNTYNTRVVESNTRVSYNGGQGGVEARATAQEETASRERHVAPVAAQNTHAQEARSNPELRASANHGNPPATANRSEAVNEHAATNEKESAKEPAREPAKEAVAPNAKAEEKPAAVAARPTPAAHAGDLEAHKTATPNTGNAKTDQKYQKQQNSLVAKQTQDHQKLQQQQEKQHQQLTKSNASEPKKQQVEQQHQQQTQQLEQKHAAQTQKVQTHQQPAQAPQSKPAESHPSNEKPH
jgi:WXXGXW repeat (2 copies)